MNRPAPLVRFALCAFASSAAVVLHAGCSIDGNGSAANDLATITPADLAAAIGPDASSPAPDLATGSDGGTSPLVQMRPYMSKAPKDYDPARAWPLLILLHGYSASGVIQDAYFGLSGIVDSRGFLYAYPDGLKDGAGNRFWNATDACCDLGGNGVDDVAYLNAVIDDMSARYHVDPKRIFLAGHSNGGFMAHRMACDSAHRIAAIVALAGDVWNDASKCQPAEPVAVLQVHGDADATILYGGGAIQGHTYPSAAQSVGTWVAKNGCAMGPSTGAPLDLERTLLGAETTPQSWTGCRAGGAAELWTIHGGGHIPTFQPIWADTIYTWLAAHPKP